MSLTTRLRPAKAGPPANEAAPLGEPEGAQADGAQASPAQPGTSRPGTDLPGPAPIESLWQPKAQAKAKAKARGKAKREAGTGTGRAKAKPAPLSGTGIALDGTTATRVRVSSGEVVSCEVFRAGADGDALSEALSGTKGAQVVCADGILFARSVEVPGDRAKASPLALVEAGKRTWPASTLTAVAGIADAEGRAALVGWEAQGFSWAVADKAGARLLGLPLVLPDGAWLVVGAEHSWFALAEGGRPLLCRELKAGLGDFAQVAAQASVEIARLAKEGRAMSDVHVLGARLDTQATSALARVGIRGVAPVVPGVSRWEIPWAEQGPAALAALAALARPARSAWWRSPAELARLAEAPARHRHLAVLLTGGAVAAGVALTGLLPLASAHSALSSARSTLALARANEASVSRWLAMRSEVLSLSGEARSDRGPVAAYMPAVLEVEGTEPQGTSITSINAAPASGQISLTVAANVLGGSFVPVAAWQSRLQHLGATVVISGESTNRGEVGVSMSVEVPPLAKRLARRPTERAVHGAPAQGGRR